jgi:multiple sugar transport system substrate-binding protein
MRISLQLAVIGAAAILVAGCGGSGTSGASGAGDGGPTGAGETLSISGFGSGDEIAATRIALAKQAVAPAKVKNPTGGFQDQQFLTSVASGNVPDLIYLDRQKVGTYAARGALLPVDTCGVDLSQFRQPALDEVTYQGKVYGVPEFYDNRTLIIDDRVAAKAGVHDVSTTDWAKLAAASRKMSVESGGKLTRIGFDPKLPEFFPLWAKANGVDIVSADGKKANLDDPKAIEALKFAVSLIRDQGGWGEFKSFRDTWDFFGAKNEYARDQVGAFPMEDWYYNVLASNSPTVQITAKAFTDRNGKPIDYVTGSAWAIPKGATHVKLACEWAKTMTATASWVKAARARANANKAHDLPFTGLYTANKAADDKIFATLYTSKGTQFDKAVSVVRDAQNNAFSISPSAGGEAVTQAWTEAVNKVLAGQATAADALHAAQARAQKAIDAAG